MNRKDKYKDLNKWKETCQSQSRRYYRKTAFIYGRRRWTSDEEKMVYEHKIPDSVLSPIIQRSVVAIQKRRGILKHKINEVQNT